MSDDSVPPDPLGGLFEMSGADAYADTPLFRELQRVLLSSAGSPINWELARQVGIATAQQGRPDPEPSQADQHELEEAVRLAELQVAAFTGLGPPPDVATVQAVRRAAWVQANTDGLRGMLEPAARRITEAMARAEVPGLPEDAAGAAGQLQAVMGQIAPLMLGVQVGQVLGSLGARVLGQYDIAVPRAESGRMLFVVPNIEGFERDWSLPQTEFRTWVALHEVTHRYEFARPWASERFRHLVDDFLSTLEVDVAGMQERLGSMDPSDPTSIQEAFSGEDALFGTVLDDEQRIKLGRVQAFMAAAEGYGDHVMHGIGRSLLPAYARLDEAMRRYREDETSDPVFERLLGIDVKREQYAAGRAFSDTVVELTDESTLAQMWESPEAMPSLPEVEEPRLWLARTV